jgi:coenzyme PQQ synthesis protein D (PqqD)
MKTQKPTFLPEARHEGIVTREADGELLIYDRSSDKAHCLNPLAGAIWKYCDGRTPVKEIAASLEKETNTQVDERVVWLGLEELRRSHLLEKPTAWPSMIAGISGMSRREAIRRIGLGAAIALPIVISITAPTPVQAAASCGAKCKMCSTGTECCSGVCASGVSGCGPGMRCT